MVIKEFPDFFEWLSGASSFFDGAIGTFLVIALVCSLLGLFVGYLIAVIRHGPFEAFYVCANVVFQAAPDFIRTSPRRVWAIARLSVKEAMRRRVVLVAFLIFAIALLFGGWFLNSGVEHPERVYINFVMWGTQILVLMMALLISAFSLPEDIKNRTIFTVATKPVRATEIVFGRILGFGLLGTGLLALMAVLSLGFVYNGLDHTHEMEPEFATPDQFQPVDPNKTGRRPSEFAVTEGKTQLHDGHFHYVELLEEERSAEAPPPNNMDAVISQEQREDKIVYRRVYVRPQGSHTHTASVDPESGEVQLSPAKGYFRTRVPLYASSLTFYDREGNPRHVLDPETGEFKTNEEGELITEGISVGDVWSYRRYISGGPTLARAEFDFENFRPGRFSNPDLIPLELTLAVYRGYKGNINRRIQIGIQFESIPDDPENDQVYRSEVMEFESNEFDVQVKGIPRSLPGFLLTPDGEQIRNDYFDLFDDFASNGKLRVKLTCREQGQYIGVARGDVYFRAAEGNHAYNFLKGYIGIWLQMLIVTSLAVGLSTFLSSPVTLLVAVCSLTFGFFAEGIREFSMPGRDGGGPIESLVRLVTQKNMQVKLEESFQTQLMKAVDRVLLEMLESLTMVVPDFSRLDFSQFIKYGYYIDNERILIAAVATLAFCFGVSVLGYFCLKTRELAG